LKPTTDNTFRFSYAAGGTTKTVDLTTSSTAWVPVAMTWSAAADEMKAYAAGVQTGSTQTGLEAYTGSLDSSLCVIGALNTSAANDWIGNIAHVAVWSTPLTLAQIESLSTV